MSQKKDPKPTATNSKPTSSSKFFQRCKSSPYALNIQSKPMSPISLHPKDLVSDCEFIEESLTLIEKNNINLLQTKLHEQTKLIMFYKNRCDHFSRKNISLESLTQALIDQRPVKFLRVDNRSANKDTEFLSRSKQFLRKTDHDIMKSEINEQTNLIMFYKNQTENYMKLNNSLEKHNKSLIEMNTALNKNYNELNARFEETKAEFEKKILGLNLIINESKLEIEKISADNEKSMQDIHLKMEQSLAELMVTNQKNVQEIMVKNELTIQSLKDDFTAKGKLYFIYEDKI